MQFFEKSNHIVKDYFNSDGKAQINFSLKPMSLDKNASQFSLLIGDRSFIYAHGPQESLHYQWPFDLNQSSVDLSVTGFSSEPNHLSAEGSWAIFNIFSHAQINKVKDGYLMEYRLGDLNFSWLCETDSPMRAFNLEDFTSLNFPNRLTLRVENDIQ
jgi:type VI protein secretion system component VasK